MVRAEFVMKSLAAALVVTGLVALGSVAPADAQTKGGAKPGATGKPATSAKADAKAGKGDAKAAKPACATEAKASLPEAKKKDEAKAAFKEGHKRFEAGDYDNALGCYKLAEAYVPGAKPKFGIASSFDKLGKVHEAVAAYKRYLRDVAPSPDAKVEDKFKADVESARKRIEVLEKTPNKVTVVVRPVEVTKPKIDLDGVRQTSEELTVPPGKHTITVTADGYDVGTAAVELGFAETREVMVALGKKLEPAKTAGPSASAAPSGTGAAPTASASAVASSSPRPPENKGKVLMVVGGTFLGIAAVRAIVGGVFGGMAVQSKAEFDAMVAGPHQRSEALAKAEETRQNGRLADISFGAAIAGAIPGLVLVIMGARQPAPEATPTPNTGAATLKRGFIAPVVSSDGGGATVQFTF